MLPSPPTPFEVILKSSLANALLSTVFGIWAGSFLAGIACFLIVCVLVYAFAWAFNRYERNSWQDTE